MATADEVVVKLTAQTAEYDRRITASENNFVNSVARMSAQAMGMEAQIGQSFKQLAVEAEIAGRKIGEALGGATAVELRDDDIQEYGRALDALRAKFNPIFAASKQYEAASAEINRAHALGAISAEEQAAALQRLNAQYQAQTKLQDPTRAAREGAKAYARELDQLRAKFNPIYAASKQYEAALNEINRAQSMGAISAQEQTAAITRLNAAYTSSAKAVTTVGTNSRMAQQQARNLAFQFQDIGTMLAAGQSPFMLLAQQLPQVTMYGGQMTGVMGALKSTFAGLLSPLGLATTGFVLLASVAIPYLTDLVNSGKISNEELEKQAQRVQAIADKWGIALPALKRYADERERLKTLEGVDEATGLEIGKRYEAARKELDLLRVSFDNITGAIGLSSLEANNAFAAMNNLETAIRANKATVEDVDAVIAVLTASYNQSLDPAIKAIITSLEAFRNTVATAAGETAALTNEAERFKAVETIFIQMQSAINSLSTASARQEAQQLYDKFREGEISIEDLISALGDLGAANPSLQGPISEIQRLGVAADVTRQKLAAMYAPIGGANTVAGGKGDRISNLPGTMNAPSFKPNDIQLDNEAFAREQAAAKKGGGGRDKAIREAEREAEAIAKLIDQLEFELEMIGKTDREKLIETNVRRLAASATGEQAERVRELTGAIYDQKEAQDRANDAAKEFNDLAKSALSSFINDIKNGVSAADALANALSKVGDKLLDMALDGLFSSKGGGGIGGFLSSLFGGFRANGGPVGGGKAYVVGERGPELFMPGQAGSIIPNIPNMTGGGQSGSVVVNFNPVIDNRGASAEAVARNEMQIEKLKRDLPAIVTQSVRKAQKSNVKLN